MKINDLKSSFIYFGLFLIILMLYLISYNKEKHNSFQTSKPLSLNSVIRDSLKDQNDLDYFNFSLKRQSLLSIQLKHLKDNLSFTLLDQNKTPILFQENNHIEIHNLYLPSGKYFIKICTKISTPLKKSLQYLLKITSLNPKINHTSNIIIEHESPLDNFSVQTLSPEKKIYGFSSFYHSNISSSINQFILREILHPGISLSTEYDLDYFILKNDQPSNSFIQFFIQPPARTSFTLVAIEDQLFQYLKKYLTLPPTLHETANDIYQIRANTDQNIVSEILNIHHTPFLHLFFISTKANQNNDSSSLQDQSMYSISFKSIPSINQPFEIEPNQTIKLSNLIQTSKIKGQIHHHQDIDVYKIKTIPQWLTHKPSSNMPIEHSIIRNYMKGQIILKPSKNLDIALDIYSKDQKLLTHIDNFKTGQVEFIPNIILEDNSLFYLKVFSPQRKIPLPNQYTITSQMLQMMNDKEIEIEPNDTLYNQSLANQTANSFSENIHGYINYQDDIDHVFFIIPSSGKYTVTLKAPHTSKIDVKIYNKSNILIQNLNNLNNSKMFFEQNFSQKTFLHLVISGNLNRNSHDLPQYFIHLKKI